MTGMVWPFSLVLCLRVGGRVGEVGVVVPLGWLVAWLSARARAAHHVVAHLDAVIAAYV